MVLSKEFEIENFNDWFNEIIIKAELADLRYNIKGIVVYRPWSVYSINKMFRIYENILSSSGHQQVILPTLIPEENFLKEGEHVEGFIPEVFWVTKHGDEDFENKLALRPTSETAFYYMFKYWLQSYKELPMKTYQRANIFRYDTKATKPFFRGREFYFFETHNIFETYEESVDEVFNDMQISEDIIHEELGIPFLFFKRPQWDKFPGALDTYGADTLMPNGKLTQLVTTHTLGQRFTKAFEVKYKDKDEIEKYPYGTCYGPGITRMYGAMISVHGDKLGLRLPFNFSPIEIIILPLYFNDIDEEKLESLCLEIAEDLDKLGYKVKIDDQKEKRPKERFNYYETKGVPIRLEIGPKDLENQTVTIFRRDLNSKIIVHISELFEEVDNIADEFTLNLKEQADLEFNNRIISANNIKDIKKELDQGKMIKIPFCSIDMDGKSCADELKTITSGAEVRGVRVDSDVKPAQEEICPICGKKATEYVYVAKSY